MTLRTKNSQPDSYGGTKYNRKEYTYIIRHRQVLLPTWAIQDTPLGFKGSP